MSISQTSSKIESEINTISSTKGLVLLKTTEGKTFIAMDYDNLNYVIKLLEAGKYDKKRLESLKFISTEWEKKSLLKDSLIGEQNKQIQQYIEIKIINEENIFNLKQNITDLNSNIEDYKQIISNDKNIIINKDIIIDSKNKKIKRKNKIIVGIVTVFILTLIVLKQ